MSEHYCMKVKEKFSLVHFIFCSTYLGHGIAHTQIELLANRGQLISLKVKKGRLGLFDLRRHSSVLVCVCAFPKEVCEQGNDQ